jgi:hypothetical protein
MMIIDVPVAPFSAPAKIREWIQQLEAARADPDAEASDLVRIEDYIGMARGWLAKKHATPTVESGNAA